jgi:hypothetical protein
MDNQNIIILQTSTSKRLESVLDILNEIFPYDEDCNDCEGIIYNRKEPTEVTKIITKLCNLLTASDLGLDSVTVRVETIQDIDLQEVIDKDFDLYWKDHQPNTNDKFAPYPTGQQPNTNNKK